MRSIEKKVAEKIKVYSNKKYLDGYIRNEFLTDDGEANVFLKVDDKNELFDKRTINNQTDLRKEIYMYATEKTSMLDNNIKINFHITGIKLDSKDEGKIKHMFKEHFAIELYKVQKKYIRCKNKILKLFALGIFFFTTYTFLFLYTKFDFFIEVCGFLFSFALWEASDCIIYEFSEIKKEREAVTQNLLMNIVFDEE